MAEAGTLTLTAVSALPPAPVTAAEAPPAAPGRSSRAVLGAAALIVVAGGVIRFAGLSTSIWFDESGTIQQVRGSFGQVLQGVMNHELAPPFYFICLWIWRHLVGATAVDLRALSALCGTFTIALAFYVGQRRLGSRAGLILAACVAASPVLFYYSTEMRMYGVLVLLTGIGFEAFLCALESPSRRNLSVWATASLLALWTQYYAALAVAPQAIWLIGLAWKHRSRARATLAAIGVAALGALPLIYLIVYQLQHAFPYAARVLSSPWRSVPLSINDTGSTFGSLAEDVTAGPGGPARALLSALIVLIGAAIALFLLRRPERVHRQLPRLLCLTVPPVLVVVIVVHSHILFQGRYLLPLWLPVGLAVSWALSSLGRLGLALTGVLVCVWVAAGVASFAVPKFAPRDDTQGAARSLGTASTDRLIALSQPWDVLAFQEYRPQTAAENQRVVRVRELDVVAMPLGGEPPPSEHQRPSTLGAGTLPKGLRLAQVIRGPTFLVERFVTSRPLAIRVDGTGPAFTSSNWRFLVEPAGGRMGRL
jgi:4-amino-4-deoxy-L-arabinose transferase-like glycosyltransferase